MYYWGIIFYYKIQKNSEIYPEFLRAIDGARTRGLDLGKVARYQLRHYRTYKLISSATKYMIL